MAKGAGHLAMVMYPTPAGRGNGTEEIGVWFNGEFAETEATKRRLEALAASLTEHFGERFEIFRTTSARMAIRLRAQGGGGEAAARKLARIIRATLKIEASVQLHEPADIEAALR